MDMKKLQQFHSLLGLFSSSSSSSSPPVPNLHPQDFGTEEWEIAERRVHEILSAIQPTVNSERRRKKIIEYIQILIAASYGIRVFPFGSVPLKTYLPDGDIDLSALSNCDEEVLSSTVCSVLQNEATMNTQVQVKDVQCVPAQVKVVKCYVEGISVDISFNQIDGLCALSFLEQVDQLIGKDHLFKRSIILIKAWCFYESRILGANYGLLSTYALETMIAHIINLFHSSLHSPLAVLYKFLGYYSKFDWENHCVAIDGLVQVSSLPEVVAKPPDESDDMLLGAEFLQKCRKAYSFSTGINQTGENRFPIKFLNVIDPLRDNNNIGRSINKANFNRIKFAFAFATDKLNTIFALPQEEISKGIETFFKTTLARNALVPGHVDGKSEASEKLNHLDNENVLAGIQYGLWFHEFGIYQGCNNSIAIPEMWNKCNHLGLGGRYDLNTLFKVNDSKTPTGETTKSRRGTGTYIPKPVYNLRIPIEVRRKREHAPRVYKPVEEEECDDGIESFCLVEEGSSSCITMSVAEFPPLPDNLLVKKSDEFETKQNSTMVNSPPPIDTTKAEVEEEEEEEEEVTMIMVENLNLPPESEDMEEETEMRLGDTSEFPPLQGKLIK